MTDWREAIDRGGACAVPSVLDADGVRRLTDSLRGGGEPLRRRGGGEFGRRNVLDLPAVAEAAASPGVRAVVGAVLGPRARPVRGLFFDKTPEANWTVPWHQDRSVAVAERRDVPGYGPWSVKAGVVHVQPPTQVLRGMLTVRLHLDDCGPANGPLRMVPGTHRDLLDPAAIAAAAGRGPAVALTCGSGDAVVMRPLVLHASSPAAEPGHRRVVHLEFAAGDLPGGLGWRFGGGDQ